MKELVINLKKWYRGQGSDGSRLRRSDDGMQCCLGFYLRACGLKAKLIEDRTMPYRVWSLIPDEAKWLLDSRGDGSSGISNRLAMINDNPNLAEAVRKKRIKSEFAKHKVKVVFK